MVIAFLALSSLHKAYTKPTRCLHKAYIGNGNDNGNLNKNEKMKEWKNEKMGREPDNR